MNLLSFLSSSLQPRVAILDAETLIPIFTSASPMRVTVHQEKRPTKFAVEDGTDRSDHVVKELTEVTIDFLLTEDTRNSYAELRQAFDENRLVTVQTKVDTIENMLIVSMPREETPRLGSSVAIPIRLQEWVEVKPEEGEISQNQVASKEQSSTVKRGQVKGTEANTEQKQKGSILSGWFS